MMPLTMEQVRAAIDPDEPNYAEAARLGPDALPFLAQLVQGDDPMLASKAAYLAGIIRGPKYLDVLGMAATSSHTAVRIAAATALGLSGDAGATPLLSTLLGDPDLNVRRMTLESIGQLKVRALKDKVEELARRDPEVFIRELANQVLKRLGAYQGQP